ncbi:hypothetical protein N3K64_04750 [Escherichia coli]|uniref:hypothetical protein n=1 Tax=Escherichia coli TaxID=562 RepID=UPI0021BECD85|nr:hypothetical protein [Escherichia coli]MCT9829199.1 hypothetical protein [Escherichia coli]
MTLSKENLQFIEDYDTVEPGEAAAMARELLALRKELEGAEPVAWRYRYAKPGFELGWVMVEDEALCNRSANYQVEPLYTAPPAPVVPDEQAFYAWTRSDVDLSITLESETYMGIAKASWEACRAAMLQGAEPVSGAYKLPDGWVAVPVEPTQEMIDAHVEGVQSGGMQKGYRAMLAAAPAPGKEG